MDKERKREREREREIERYLHWYQHSGLIRSYITNSVYLATQSHHHPGKPGAVRGVERQSELSALRWQASLIGSASYIVKVLCVPQILHFEPSLDAFSSWSDVISSMKTLCLGRSRRVLRFTCAAPSLDSTPSKQCAPSPYPVSAT